MIGERIRNQNGQSLIQVLFAIGILGLTSSVIGFFSANVSRQTLALYEKASQLDVQRQLIMYLSSGSLCNFELTNAGPWISSPMPLTFDASTIGSGNPPQIALNQILEAPTAGAAAFLQTGQPVEPGESLIVQSLVVDAFEGAVTDSQFIASVRVTFDGNRLVQSLKPVSAQIIINTSGAGNIKTITGCSFSQPPSNAVKVSITTLHANEPGCGPLSGYSNFVARGGPGDPSSGMLLKNCFTGCSRYCRSSLGYSGGTLVDYYEPTDMAECVCIP